MTNRQVPSISYPPAVLPLLRRCAPCRRAARIPVDFVPLAHELRRIRKSKEPAQLPSKLEFSMNACFALVGPHIYVLNSPQMNTGASRSNFRDAPVHAPS